MPQPGQVFCRRDPLTRAPWAEWVQHHLPCVRFLTQDWPPPPLLPRQNPMSPCGDTATGCSHHPCPSALLACTYQLTGAVVHSSCGATLVGLSDFSHPSLPNALNGKGTHTDTNTAEQLLLGSRGVACWSFIAPGGLPGHNRKKGSPSCGAGNVSNLLLLQVRQQGQFSNSSASVFFLAIQSL